MFMLAMIPTFVRLACRNYRDGSLLKRVYSTILRSRHRTVYNEPETDTESEAFLKPPSTRSSRRHKYLGLLPTARLSFAFCMLWFGANYFAMACLQYTTVASTTILTATSSIWTLLIGALTRIERFTWRKLCGVLASLVGIVLISHADFTSDGTASSTSPPPPSQMNYGGGGGAMSLMATRAMDSFPDKPPSELALGDALALLSAVLYGVYTITLKKSSLTAAPLELDMTLFFGLVGTFNLVLLLPLFPVLHFTGLEPFVMPPTRRVWAILIVNSISSFVSDICWAYAMVLTSPLVVTVGLSLTIPLSLVGEMVLQSRYEGWLYWLGAAVVVGSFLFVDREESKDDAEGETAAGSGDRTVGDPSSLRADGVLAREVRGSETENRSVDMDGDPIGDVEAGSSTVRAHDSNEESD